MKTVFKEGMKVYDQLNFPDVEGVVTSTNFIPEKSFFDKEKGFEEDFEEDYEHPYPIEVDFKGEQALYKNDGSGFMNFPTLSTKPYKVELVDFEQKAPIPTYDEVIMKNGSYISITKPLELPSEELKNAFEALAKLIWLRDYYNEGWQPDWSTKNSMHFCIRVRNNKITIDSNSDINEFNTVLVFRDYTVRDKFLEEQKELLEIAKPLL